MIGCGCLLLVVAAVVTGIVLLVSHWDAMFGGSGSGSGSGSGYGSPVPSDPAASTSAGAPAKATATATVRAGTVCPEALLEVLPAKYREGTELLAVYRRTDGAEEYAFCHTSGGDFYFNDRPPGPSGTIEGASAAKRITGGFDVPVDGTGATGSVDYRFVSGKLTAYEGGKATWSTSYVSKSAL